MQTSPYAKAEGGAKCNSVILYYKHTRWDERLCMYKHSCMMSDMDLRAGGEGERELIASAWLRVIGLSQ